MSDKSNVDYKQPAVQWAQREDCIWLTILVENCTVPIIKILPNRLSFKGRRALAMVVLGFQIIYEEHNFFLDQ